MIENRLTSKRAYISFTFLLIAVTLIQPMSVVASDPASIDLWYDYNDQRIFVTIGHSVTNPETHFIQQINITVNGEHQLTVDYTSQEDAGGMTDDFAISAADGDIIGVAAYCNLGGSIYDELTVVATETTSATSATNTGTTDIITTTNTSTTGTIPGLQPELIIITAVGGILVVVILLVALRMRKS